MSRVSIAIEIANRVDQAERATSTALGHDRLDTIILSGTAWFDTFNAMFEADRPAVYLPARMIGNMTA